MIDLQKSGAVIAILIKLPPESLLVLVDFAGMKTTNFHGTPLTQLELIERLLIKLAD